MILSSSLLSTIKPFCNPFHERQSAGRTDILSPRRRWYGAILSIMVGSNQASIVARLGRVKWSHEPDIAPGRVHHRRTSRWWKWDLVVAPTTAECQRFSRSVDDMDPYQVRGVLGLGSKAFLVMAITQLLLGAQIRRKWGRHGQVDGGGRWFWQFYISSYAKRFPLVCPSSLDISHDDPKLVP